MATLAFKPYTYKPTAPRFQSITTHRRTVPEPVSIKIQHITPDSESLKTPRSVADDGGYRPETRGIGTVFGGSDKASDDETDNDGRDLPTIEELLFSHLPAQGFITGDGGFDKTRGVKEVTVDKRTVSVNQTRSRKGNNSGGSPDDPSDLLGDGSFSFSEADVNNNALCAESTTVPGPGLFDSPETANESTTPAPPCSSYGCYDFDDFLKRAPRLPLAEQEASTSDPLYPCTSSTRLLNEPLYDSVGTELSRHARSEATTSSSSPLPRHYRASPETQLSQEGRFHTVRDVADDHGLVNPKLDTLSLDKGMREHQEVEEEKGKYDIKDKDRGLQEGNGVAAAVTTGRAGGSPRPANGRQSHPNLDPSPDPSYDEECSGSNHDSDELKSPDLVGDDEKKPRPPKRKQPSSSHGGLEYKKRRRPLQQSPPHKRRSLYELHRRYPKSQSPLNQRSSVTMSSNAKGRLASLTLSVPHATDRGTSPDCSNVDRSSEAALPTLTEVTFRPHSPHNCSFTAVIRDGCDGRGVSFSQVTQLIECIGHVGKIDDFTIKPMEQNLFLLTGFSQHTLSQPLPSVRALSTAEVGRIHRNKSRTRSQDGRAVDARSLISRSGSSSSDDDDGLSDSDTQSSSNDDGWSSRDEQGLSSMSKHSRWNGIDEQRLLAYKKENKTWDWIFKKFPGRTRATVRTRWTMVRARGD